VNDVIQLPTIESLCGSPLLGAVDARGSRLAAAHEDGQVRSVVALRKLVLHKLYQLISETEEDV